MIGVVAACAVARGIVAQLPAGTQLADAGPRFLAAPPAGHPDAPRGDVRYASVFLRPIALRLEDVPLGDALDSVARAAGMHVSVSAAALVLTRPVSLTANHIAVGAALTALLYNAHVDVQLEADGATITLVPRASRLTAVKDRQASGRIEGRVTDATTGQPFAGATVIVDATGYRAATKADGHYAIVNVPGGTYTITTRLLGHTPLSKRIGVGADSVTHVDFALTEAAAALEQVVTTAVGDQRKVELGNSIATINADSVVRTAPVAQVTDVLGGRVPGVEVLEQQGQVGAGPRIRIRGLSSFTLSNDPIIYIDGMRLDGSGGASINSTFATPNTLFPTPSRLNDIDPSDIASIDVLKGPSAATEYGTDAANGVIVIKTKHGHAGRPQWDVHAEHGLSTIPEHFPVATHAFGHTTDGTNTPVECPRTFGFGPTTTNGGCVVDSVTTYQPLDHAATSLFTTGGTSRLGAQVSGGVPQMQYFLSGSYDNATGVLQLPPFYRQRLISQGRSVPGYERTPNTMDQANVRGRVMAALGTTSDVSFSTTYIANNQRSGNDFLAVYGAALTDGNRNDGFGGYGIFGGFYVPTTSFGITGAQAMRRFAGSTNATWRPGSWLNTRATVGVDYGSRTNDSYQAPGPDPFGFTSVPGSTGTGYHGVERLATTLYTVDLGATATASLSASLTSKTSVGAQYNARAQGGTLAQAFGLTANGSLNGASLYRETQIDSADRTAGSYVEESLGWHDRLFLTGAVRVDAGSGFGSKVNAATYPKASVSWVAVRGPSHRLRVRAAYGESGVQPPNGATLSLLTPATAVVGGNLVTGDTGTVVANSHLQPERSAELETGFDAGVWHDRVTFELTYYHKQTRNTIVANILPGSDGGRTEYENLGEVLNYGVESTLGLQVLDTKTLAWDATLGTSLNQNRLVSLAPGVPPLNAPFFPFLLQYRQVPGYPLFGLWAPQLVYADANHDGVIEPTEVSQTTTLTYQGSSFPTRTFTMNTGLSLFGRRIRVAGQVDYRGGDKIQNALLAQIEAFPTAKAFNDPHISLAAQARAVENSQSSQPIVGAYFQDGSFVRWRELSVTYVLPDRLAQSFHLRSGSVTVLGRNLLLWTHYLGADPESQTSQIRLFGPPDAAEDIGSTPLPRSVGLRVNLGV